MKRAGFSPPERLLFDVQSLIAEVKSQFFSDTDTPLNDNDTLVHKLCVRLENVLRYGAREKYTFMGTKKDYWNYACESIPKDEVIKFVQSISELKTNQGKGRALLRQCLTEKCLADMLQRCALNEKMTKEYYVTDSILRNPTYLESLVHTLYDLNSINFQLPHKGYDLDRSFPSFSRKTFGETLSRRASIESVKAELDPVILIHTGISELASILNSWTGKDSISTGLSAGHSPTLKENIERLKVISSLVQNIRGTTEKSFESMRGEMSKLEDEKLKSDAEYELRLKQLHERYVNIQNLDVTATTDKFKELYDKLVATELELKTLQANYEIKTEENSSLQQQLDDSVSEICTISTEKDELSKTVDGLKGEIEQLRQCEHCNESTNKILESKLTELQKINNNLKTREKQLSDQLQTVETTLRLREEDLAVLKDAFQRSTGLVVDSFKELKEELNSQIGEKNSTLKETQNKNENLLKEANSLQREKHQLTQRIEALEEKIIEETRKREGAEKTAVVLKEKIAEELRHQSYMQKCVTELWESISAQTDGFDEVDGETDQPNFVDMVAVKTIQQNVLKKLTSMKQELNDTQIQSNQHENDVIVLQRLSSTTTENLKDLEKELEERAEELQSVKKELEESKRLNEELTNSDNKHTDDLINLSTEIFKLNEEAATRENQLKELTNKMNNEQSKSSLEITRLTEDLSKSSEKCTEYENELKQYEEKLQELQVAKKLLEEDAERLENQLKNSSNLKQELMKTVESYEQNQESYIKEVKFLKQEIENAVNIKNQEIQSLRFEKSSLEMKHEATVNKIDLLKKESEMLANQLSEKEVIILDLHQRESNESSAWLSEKEELTKGNTDLQKLLKEIQEKFTVAEKEVTFLKVQVSKLAKEKDEEKAQRINATNRLSNSAEERKKMEQKYKEEISMLQEDISEIKSHLVNVTKDKHELWQQKDFLEFELRQKGEERWVNDKEAKTCTTCLSEFSLTQRKHHCRLCGQIFCHNCSNRWVKTAHSRKKVRACNVCANNYEEKNGDKPLDQDTVDNRGLDSQSNADSMSISSRYESFDQQTPISDDEEVSPQGEGSFEVLDNSNLSHSGPGFLETNEKILIEPNDTRLELFQPIIQEIPSNVQGNEQMELTEGDTSEDLRQKIEINLLARKRCFVAIIIELAGLELEWQFNSAPKDVGFGIAYKKKEELPDAEMETIIPLSRYISHKQAIHGKMIAEKEGLYYLCFSNAYSRFTNKTVTCFVSLYKKTTS